MHSSGKIFLGIDEAGRGSVIGPLVIGAVIADEKTLEFYSTTNLTDSKQLKPLDREKLYSIIRESSTGYSTIILNPSEIDKALLDPNDNLNLLELVSMSKLINQYPNATDIIIDAISTPDYCTNNLKILLKKIIHNSSIKKVHEDTLLISRPIQDNIKKSTLIAQNKADLNFKIVSAASIIAKVSRDMHIRFLETEFHLETGILASGYPNDQLLPFLKKYKKSIQQREFPFIRYQWNWPPLKSILNKDNLKQTKLF
jgi:ribonuclease HII